MYSVDLFTVVLIIYYPKIVDISTHYETAKIVRLVFGMIVVFSAIYLLKSLLLIELSLFVIRTQIDIGKLGFVCKF